MNAQEVYDAMLAAGFTLYTQAGKLMVSPSKLLKDEDRVLIREHRDELYKLADQPVWFLWKDGKVGLRVASMDRGRYPEDVIGWRLEGEENWRILPNKIREPIPLGEPDLDKTVWLRDERGKTVLCVTRDRRLWRHGVTGWRYSGEEAWRPVPPVPPVEVSA